MWILAAIAAAAAFLAAVAGTLRLALVKRQVRSLTAQLARVNRRETGKRLTLSMWDRDLERLAAEINRHTALVEQAEGARRRSEDELRQAIANMSHDLRTPLTSISGYIQLLESAELPEEKKKEAIGIIRNRTGRLRTLLNDFFELSVIDLADYELRLEPLPLNRLLPDVLLGFYDRLSDSKLVPEVQMPEEPIVMLADEEASRRVLENLIANAVRHATGTLGIQAQRTDKSAVLVLSNDASHLRGFDPELLFDRFYMADRSRTGKSAGLGLSIARGLMRKMGGSLTADMDGDRLRMRCEWPLADRSRV